MIKIPVITFLKYLNKKIDLFISDTVITTWSILNDIINFFILVKKLCMSYNNYLKILTRKLDEL